MRLKLFLVTLICFCFQQSSRANFVMNANCIAAYNAIFDLRYVEARKLIKDEKAKNPNNGITILLEDYLDYLYLQTTGNKAEYDKVKGRRSDRIDALEDNDENSPYYLFAQSEVYIHWGALKAQFGDYTASVMDLNKARKLTAENASKFKDFTPNKKNQAWLEIMFGAIPSNLKSVAGFFGLKGNLDSGYKHLEDFRNEIRNSKYNYYNDEVVFLLCITNTDVMRAKNSYERMVAMMNEVGDKSLLKKYLQGYIAFKTGHSTDAIGFLTSAPQSAEYVALPSINYWLGNAKLCRMDSDADDHLLKFIRDNRSPSFVKDAYLKLAYFELMHGNEGGYNNYLKLVKQKGSVSNEKDKQALKEANDAEPDAELLKSRFYFDGGYYNNSLTLLKKKNVNDLKLLRDKIELYYRLGRTYDKMNNATEALINYQKAIAIGRNSSYYYAANSALFSGLIFEQRRDVKKAAEYFNTALKMKNHEYQNSIDTQAEEGLKRVKAN